MLPGCVNIRDWQRLRLWANHDLTTDLSYHATTGVYDYTAYRLLQAYY